MDKCDSLFRRSGGYHPDTSVEDIFGFDIRKLWRKVVRINIFLSL
jgi:hypothetical protein